MGLAVFLVMPTLVAPVDAELTSGSDTCWLSHFDLLSVISYDGQRRRNEC